MTLWEARFSWIWLGNCACRLGSRGDNFKFFSASRRKIWNSLLLTPTYAHNFSQIHSNLASQSVISAKTTGWSKKTVNCNIPLVGLYFELNRLTWWFSIIKHREVLIFDNSFEPKWNSKVILWKNLKG